MPLFQYPDGYAQSLQLKRIPLDTSNTLGLLMTEGPLTRSNVPPRPG